jgi:hypothetical protein
MKVFGFLGAFLVLSIWAPQAKAQVEELHIFYVDMNILNYSVENYTSSLSYNMTQNALKKVDSCYSNNWEVVCYFPSDVSSTVIDSKDQMERLLKSPPSKAKSKPVNYSHDAKVLRDFIYGKLGSYQKLAKISFYFYLPPHALDGYFYQYNSLRNFLLDEISNKDVVANEIEIQYNLTSVASPGLPKNLRNKLRWNNLIRQINFFERNPDFSADNKIPSFFYY